MATTLLERADTEFKQLRERRTALQEEHQRLQGDVIKQKDAGRSQSELHQSASRLRELNEEIRMLAGPYAVAKQKAHQSAVKRIKESAEYGRAVLDAALGWAAAIDRSRSLVSLMEQARREGVNLLPLPPTIAAPIEIKAWVHSMMDRGDLDGDKLPASLKALVEGGAK